MTPEQLIEFRNKIIKLLQENVCEIDFLKKNGEVRLMFGTLNPAMIPKSERKTDRIPKESVYSISCIDVNKKMWRAFRLGSLRGIKIHAPTPPQTI